MVDIRTSFSLAELGIDRQRLDHALAKGQHAELVHNNKCVGIVMAPEVFDILVAMATDHTTAATLGSEQPIRKRVFVSDDEVASRLCKYTP